MATFAWRPFLEQYSRELLADREIRTRVSDEVLRSQWMGFDPANREQLRDLEDRIGNRLPDSYSDFLATSNGWRESGGAIDEILPCTKVEWFRAGNQEWIDAYQTSLPVSLAEHCTYGERQNPCEFRAEFLQSALMVSDVGDSAVYLLNPEIKTAAGEWEAWFFANWLPGATRYRSFWDLMQAECRSFASLRDHSEKRYFPEDGIETLPRKLAGLIDELVDKAKQHTVALQQRVARGESSADPHTAGIVSALVAASAEVKRIETRRTSPDSLYRALADLAQDLERKWKANFDPHSCGVDERSGLAEGNREATGIVRWFLNEP